MDIANGLRAAECVARARARARCGAAVRGGAAAAAAAAWCLLCDQTLSSSLADRPSLASPHAANRYADAKFSGAITPRRAAADAASVRRVPVGVCHAGRHAASACCAG